MALGLPAIPVVRVVNDRVVQVLADAVRERLRQIEAQLTATAAQAGQSTLTLSQSNSSISNLQSQIAALRAQVDAMEVASSGPVASYRADDAISADDVVFGSSATGVSTVDPDDAASVFGVLGIATASAGAGAQVAVRRSGVHTVSGGALTTGRAVYAAAGGGLTQTSSSATAVPIGVALSSTTLLVTPGWPALQDAAFDTSYQDHMPVTYGLAASMAAAGGSGGGEFLCTEDGFIETDDNKLIFVGD